MIQYDDDDDKMIMGGGYTRTPAAGAEAGGLEVAWLDLRCSIT